MPFVFMIWPVWTLIGWEIACAACGVTVVLEPGRGKRD